MRHVNVVMVRCPSTGGELSTGVEMDEATFEQLSEIRSQMNCPVCGSDLSGRRAKLGSGTQFLRYRHSLGCLSITGVQRTTSKRRKPPKLRVKGINVVSGSPGGSSRLVADPQLC